MKQKLIMSVMFIIVYFNCLAQKIKYNSNIDVKGNIVTKTFNVKIEKSGKYYMGMVLHGNLFSIKHKPYSIFINGKKLKGNIKISRKNIYPELFKNNSKTKETLIELYKGNNTITFQGYKNVPQIEYIQLSDKKEKAKISTEGYKNYMTKLRQKSRTMVGRISKKDKADRKSNLQKSYTLPPKDEVYDYMLDVDYKYTYFYTDMMPPYRNMTFTTRTTDSNTDPVLYFFKTNAPMEYNTANDDGGDGLNSKLNVFLSEYNLYTIMIKSYDEDSEGVIGLTCNNIDWGSDIPISTQEVSCDKIVNGTMNYFTSNSSNNLPFLWLFDNENKIIGYGDGSIGNFPMSEVLIHDNFNTRISHVMLSGSFPSDEIGRCDVYMNVPDLNRSFWDDCAIYYNPLGMVSASTTTKYNCWAWAFENRIDKNIWPTNDEPTLFPNSGTIEEYTEYMNNHGYTLISGSIYNEPEEAELVLYYEETNLGVIFAHISVRKSPNHNNDPSPHGYAWESKMGEQERIFHPTVASIANIYESTNVQYYKKGNNQKSSNKIYAKYSLKEAIFKGLVEFDTEKFSDSDKKLVQKLKQKLNQTLVHNFKFLYSGWKETWKSPELIIKSNPYAFTYSTEYKKLMKFCKENKTATTILLIEKLDADGLKIIAPLYHLTYEENKDLYKKVVAKIKKKSQNNNGKLIERHAYSDAVYYSRKLLEKQEYQQKNLNYIPANSNDLDVNFTVYPNPAIDYISFKFYLKKEEAVILEIFSTNGQKVFTLINKKIYNQGVNKFNWNLPNTMKGTFVAKLIVGNNSKTATIVLK